MHVSSSLTVFRSTLLGADLIASPEAIHSPAETREDPFHAVESRRDTDPLASIALVPLAGTAVSSHTETASESVGYSSRRSGHSRHNVS